MSKSYKKYIKFYLAKPVFEHLHLKLSLVEPDFKYDIDVFYAILNDLSNVKYNKQYENDNYFLPYYSKLFQKKYGNHYANYKKYLINNSIICKSEYYATNKCYYYKINDIELHRRVLELNNYTYCLPDTNIYTTISLDTKEVKGIRNLVKDLELVVIKIDVKSRVGKKIIGYYNKERDRIKHYPDHIKKMAYYFKDNLEINIESANAYVLNKFIADTEKADGNQDCINKAQNAYNQRMQSILQIGDKTSANKLRFNRGARNKRIDTNLTNMAADLRPFIKGYDNMSYLDLSNSQPVLFNLMLEKNKRTASVGLLNEMVLYKEITLTGRWYEYLMDIFKVDRDSAKKLWMEIAYSKNKSWKGKKKKLAKRIPEITKVIEKCKLKYHGDLSIELQKIESKIFIDQICKELVEVGIIPYTLHDGLLVPKQREEETYAIMAKVLERNLGGIPVIAINGIKRYPMVTSNV